ANRGVQGVRLNRKNRGWAGEQAHRPGNVPGGMGLAAPSRTIRTMPSNATTSMIPQATRRKWLAGGRGRSRGKGGAGGKGGCRRRGRGFRKGPGSRCLGWIVSGSACGERLLAMRYTLLSSRGGSGALLWTGGGADLAGWVPHKRKSPSQRGQRITPPESGPV